MARAGYACEVPEECRYGHGQVVLVTVGGLLTVEKKDTREVVLLEASPTSRNRAPPSAPAVTESTADPCHYWQLVVIAFALTNRHDTRFGAWQWTLIARHSIREAIRLLPLQLAGPKSSG
jgi:hypothetical protein